MCSRISEVTQLPRDIPCITLPSACGNTAIPGKQKKAQSPRCSRLQHENPKSYPLDKALNCECGLQSNPTSLMSGHVPMASLCTAIPEPHDVAILDIHGIIIIQSFLVEKLYQTPVWFNKSATLPQFHHQIPMHVVLALPRLPTLPNSDTYYASALSALTYNFCNTT